jgi:hypothetical protein
MFSRRQLLSHWMRIALGLMLFVTLAPTVSRFVAAADPVRGAMLAEICSATMQRTESWAATTPAAQVSEQVSEGQGTQAAFSPILAEVTDCLDCLLPPLPGGVPVVVLAADFGQPPAQHPRPESSAQVIPRATPLWRQIPSRAPPAQA